MSAATLTCGRSDCRHAECLRARLAEAEAALREAHAAMEPFADPYNWHHNYDGSGIIFHIGPGGTDTLNDRVLDLIKLAVKSATRYFAVSSGGGQTREEDDG